MCALERNPRLCIRFLVVVTSGSDPPSSIQVKNGQDSTGSAALSSASNVAGLAGITISATATGLQPLTAYDVYIVAQDGAPTPNLQSSTQKLVVTTAASAPSFVGGFPHLTDVHDTWCTLHVKLTKGGRVFFHVVPTSTPGTPSAEQVRAGTFPGGVAHGNVHVPTGLVEVTTSVTSLDPESSFNVWVTAEDLQVPPNLQLTAVSVVLLTSPGTSNTSPCLRA